MRIQRVIDAEAVAETGVAVKAKSKRMNRTNDNIGWAQYSWNPVFGCEHDCQYCYSREIASRYFKKDFKPRFHEDRLGMPANTRPSAKDANNRVFVCSMADLFGDWVPREWIDRVMEVCETNKQWAYLFLTKNPKRLPTIDFPDNAWVGSTIDVQAREAGVAEAFAQMKTDKLFVSCEPLLEEITLSDKLLKALKLVIVGARSKGAVKEQPEPEWVESLLNQARKAGVAVWLKDNLAWRPRSQEFPGDLNGVNS